LIGFLNSIYSVECVNCNQLFSFKWQNCLCDECIESIQKGKDLVYCRSCGTGVFNCQRCLKQRFYKDIHVFTSYSGAIKELIHEYKLNRRRRLSKILAEKIKDDITGFVKEKKIEMILYIPLHKKVEKERGFNHLYEVLKLIFPSYMIFNGLKKIKDTKLQAQLSKEEREKNLKDAFQLEGNIKAENILVFDDVLTTGSTLMETFKTLRKSGYNGNIYGYIITKS